MRRRSALVAAAFAFALLGGCGDGDGDAGPSTASATATDPLTVVLKGNEFRPERVTIEVGETVTWQWDDGSIAHDVSGDGFKSEIQPKGTFEHTFAKAGTFEYKCTVHPTMTGSVEVTE